MLFKKNFMLTKYGNMIIDCYRGLKGTVKLPYKLFLYKELLNNMNFLF